ISSLQKNGGDVGYLDVIFGSKSFSDMITRTSAVNKITTSDAELMEQQEADMKKVEEQQTEVEEKLSELEQMEAKLVDVQKSITTHREESDQQKDNLEEKYNELYDSDDEMELEDGELAAIEYDIFGKIPYTNALADTRTSECSEEADVNGA